MHADHVTPFCFECEEMKMKVTDTERQKIIAQLVGLKQRYQPSTSWSVIHGNLVDFAKSKGFEVVETSKLAPTNKSWGEFYPYFKKIYIQKRNITRALFTLAHEVGHLILFKAGILRKYQFEEGLANVLRDEIIDVLSK